MPIDVGQGFIDILPRTDRFLSSLNSQVTRSIGEASKTASTTAQKAFQIASIGAIALGAAAVSAIGKGIQATTEWASGVRSLQKVTGQTAESASGLAGAAEHLGISVDQLTVGFGLLSKNIVNGSPALERYGISLRDANGEILPFDEVLGQVQDKFATLPNATEQTAFAMNVFGRSGKALIPILAQGRDGLADLEEAARAAGLVMSQEDVDAAKALTLAQRDLGAAFKGASIAIGKSFVPAMTNAVEGITSVVELVSRIPQPVLEAGLKFVVLTGAIAGVTKAAEFFTSTWGDVADTLGLVSDGATTVEGASTLLADSTRVAADSAVLAQKANAGLAASELAVAGASVAGVSSTAAVIAADEAWAAANEATTVTLEQQIIALQARNRAAAVPVAAPALGGAGLIAPLIGLAEGARLALQEQQALVEGDFFGAGKAVAQAFNEALGANIDLSLFDQADVDQFRTGVELVRTQLLSGAISADDAAAAIEKLREQFHVEGDTDALVAAMGGVNAAINATDEAIKAAGVSIDLTIPSFRTLTDVSGETAAEFGEAFRTAFGEASEAAAKTEDTLDDLKVNEVAFAAASEDLMAKAAAAFADFRASATSSLLGFTNDALATLADKTHLTTDKVISSFRDAAAATRDFGRDVLEISRTGGEAGAALAQQLLAAGPAAAGLAEFIAGASDKARNHMIAAFGSGAAAAEKASAKITKSILGTMQNIQTILEAIARRWGIDINLDGADKVKAGLANIREQLAALSGLHNINVALGTVGSGGHVLAEGGVIAGATGFITRQPTFLTGESSRMTFAGRGAEGVIPFDDRGIGILSEALTRALAKADQRGGDSPDLVVHLHQHLDGKEISDSVTRHQQRGRMVRG